MICELGHDFGETSRDENDDRIRNVETCAACGAVRHGCYAFRLDDEGRMAWGPPGQWWYS